MNMTDVKKPKHYTEGRKYEPKDVIRDWDLNFNLGSAIKYISRAGRKDDIIQDLYKAKEFIQFEIDALENKSYDKDYHYIIIEPTCDGSRLILRNNAYESIATFHISKRSNEFFVRSSIQYICLFYNIKRIKIEASSFSIPFLDCFYDRTTKQSLIPNVEIELYSLYEKEGE